MRAVQRISKQSGISPRSIKIREAFWSVHKASKMGGNATFKKYGRVGGDPINRKIKWRAWWEEKGKFSPPPQLVPLPVRFPNKSEKLAEMTGILMGDGGITSRQVTVTLHSKDDKAYARFVIALMYKLFGVLPSVYKLKNSSAINITISRTALVRYCNESLELKIGNKIAQNIDIPEWIKSTPRYKIACIRGLVDTDGCLIRHRYKVNGKWYFYKKLAFTSLSYPLLYSVFKELKRMGFNPRIHRRKDVRLESKADVKRYFKIIGSHNQKHLAKYQN